MSNIVIVFDFDKTIIDCDSDNWVVDEFGFTDLFNQLLPTMPWNSLMDRMMMELHSHGKSAHALGCDLRIVSDANKFFIETIVKHLGISECFTKINTNPGYVNQQGRLTVLPYHDFNKALHGCPLCPPNMCKGLIIDRIQDTISEVDNKRFIYLGDGAGDYCPSLRLRETDFVMPRKNFPVWDLICKDPSLVKAEINGWCDGQEFEQVLMKLINKIMIGENAKFISTDCKLQSLSIPVLESLPKALSVRP
ncbi:inorganic pyrophosphatase 2-like [Vicia villosa]|uniref:inorganic pyrophosphatase 2-like n=1 Tax=Vicia villosa TaxID=3911 RepID=UPI00273C5228|nr:inorganic pyrophosphatase 2-like [Vicia villosa]